MAKEWSMTAISRECVILSRQISSAKAAHDGFVMEVKLEKN